MATKKDVLKYQQAVFQVADQIARPLPIVQESKIYNIYTKVHQGKYYPELLSWALLTEYHNLICFLFCIAAAETEKSRQPCGHNQFSTEAN